MERSASISEARVGPRTAGVKRWLDGTTSQACRYGGAAFALAPDPAGMASPSGTDDGWHLAIRGFADSKREAASGGQSAAFCVLDLEPWAPACVEERGRRCPQRGWHDGRRANVVATRHVDVELLTKRDDASAIDSCDDVRP